MKTLCSFPGSLQKEGWISIEPDRKTPQNLLELHFGSFFPGPSATSSGASLRRPRTKRRPPRPRRPLPRRRRLFPGCKDTPIPRPLFSGSSLSLGSSLLNFGLSAVPCSFTCFFMDQEVHKKLCRSIVRIFIDLASEGEETDFVLIPGIIIASDDISCHILAHDKYFVDSTKTKFSVNFPKNGGVLMYEIEKSSVTMGNGIATFDVLAERAGYDTNMIEAVHFGEHTVSRCEDVFTFIFPEYPMPSRLTPGSVIHASKDVFFHDCSSNGDAHFGSPVFNEKCYLVGICNRSSAYLYAWTVPFIATMLSCLHNLKGCEGIQDYMQYINKREL